MTLTESTVDGYFGGFASNFVGSSGSTTTWATYTVPAGATLVALCGSNSADVSSIVWATSSGQTLTQLTTYNGSSMPINVAYWHNDGTSSASVTVTLQLTFANNKGVFATVNLISGGDDGNPTVVATQAGGTATPQLSATPSAVGSLMVLYFLQHLATATASGLLTGSAADSSPASTGHSNSGNDAIGGGQIHQTAPNDQTSTPVTVGAGAPSATTYAVLVEFVPPSSGGETVEGSVDAVLGGLSSTASGHRTVHGTTTAAIGALASTADGHRTVHGSAAATLAGLVATATGTRTVHGTAAVQLAGIHTAAQGRRAVHGHVSGPLGRVVTTINVTGTATGTVTAQLGGLSSSAAGKRTVHGRSAAGLGPLTTSVEGTRTAHGLATADLGRLIATIDIEGGPKHGTVTALLGRLVSTATGHRTVHGQVAANLHGLATAITLPRNGYPDIEKVLVAWAQAQYPNARVCTELPANLADVLPVIQIGRIGGQDLQVTVDRPIVDIDCYDADRDTARTFALNVWNRFRFTLPGTTTSDAVISSVRTVMAPKWVPYDNTTVRKFVFTLQLYSRNA